MFVYELLQLTDKLKNVIENETDMNEFYKLAVEEGMHPLKQKLLEHARSKIISLNEAYKLCID